MQITETKDVDVVYMAMLKDLCKYYEENEEWTIRHIIAVMHGKKIGSTINWEIENE